MSSRLEIGVGAFIAMGFACALALAFASTDVQGRLEGGTYSVTRKPWMALWSQARMLIRRPLTIW